MHIYGFGQLENVKIDNLADFQIFYGENEAGKSTIMAFIHAVFFGFPTKQQSELRYEPKHSSKYGGSIKVFAEDRGYSIIERVKGKTAAGDVSVIGEDGIRGGEGLLKELLSNVDKSLFQAIFSFNLNGLQNIHQMKGEEIGRFLFSAGTLGTDRLAFADIELQKGLDARFKPSGKKPLINEKLQELHSLHKELNLAAAKSQEYENLLQQQSTLQAEMTKVQESIKGYQKKIEIMKEWKKIADLVKEEEWTLTEINKLGAAAFPARGTQRLEALKPLLSANKAQMVSVNERVNNLKKEISELIPNQNMLENESEILSALEQYPLYQQLKLEEKQVEFKLGQVEEKLAAINEKLHFSISVEEINSVNTNIYFKERVEQLSKLSQTLKERKQQLDISFNEEKSVLEEIENNLQELQKQLIPDQERIDLENTVNEALNREKIELKLSVVRDKIELYKKAAGQKLETTIMLNRQKQIRNILFLFVLAGLAVYSWLTEQILLLGLSAIGIIGAAILLAGTLRKPVKKPDNTELQQLLQEEQQLLQMFQLVDFRKLAGLKEKLNQDQSVREQLQVMKLKYNQQLQHYDKVIKRFEEWELETSQYKKQVNEISKGLKLPEYIAESYLAEAFQLIEQYKVLNREHHYLNNEKKSFNLNQEEILAGISNLAQQYLAEKPGGIQEAVYLLKNRLKSEQEKYIKWKEKQAKLADFSADLNQLKQERGQLESDLSQLLCEAGAQSENEFYELGAKAERKAKLKARLEDLEKQVHHSFLSREDRKNCMQIRDCDEEIAKYNLEVETFQSYLTELQEKNASLKIDIQTIEEGGVYSEQLHQFKQKQYELQEAAKEWAVYSLAQSILGQTIEKYKNVHLPRMLTKAEEYLSFLTEGRYHKIFLQHSGPGFLIERQDGTIFEANELSQATTEQVYVSIRLSLATTIYEKYQFPIIIDDSFVNFDANRTQKIIQLLQQLKQNQILFFTCHQHLLQYFNKNELLCLNNGAIRHSIT